MISVHLGDLSLSHRLCLALKIGMTLEAATITASCLITIALLLLVCGRWIATRSSITCHHPNQNKRKGARASSIVRPPSFYTRISVLVCKIDPYFRLAEAQHRCPSGGHVTYCCSQPFVFFLLWDASSPVRRGSSFVCGTNPWRAVVSFVHCRILYISG